MSVRELDTELIADTVEALCMEANTTLPKDVKVALDRAQAAEPWPLARETLGLLQKNLRGGGKKTAHLSGYRHGLRFCGTGTGSPS